jgi:hypothetical protein
MATHGTDLVTLTNAESGTWTELGSPYNAGGTPALDGENFIQGSDCYSQSTGSKSGDIFSIIFDYGSNLTVSSTQAIFIWSYYSPGSNIYPLANGGIKGIIADSTTSCDFFEVGGSDHMRNPYGGWMNYAVAPNETQDSTFGGGNSGNFRYFGTNAYTYSAISKGTPHAVDAIRYGRGEIYCVGSNATFNKLRLVNDLNSSFAAPDYTNGSPTITNIASIEIEKFCIGMEIVATGVPTGTTITAINEGALTATMSANATATNTNVITYGYNRLGLFSEQGGVYLWKGLLSFGQSGTSVTFSDSNKTILVDDVTSVWSGFNKIEINNASSSVTWTNISIKALGTISKGAFEMVDNATVSMTGCLFLDMDTFAFDTNGTIDTCSFVGCGQITHGGADFDSCNFEGYEGTAGTAYMTYAESVDPDGEIDNCAFTKGTAATHAIEFDATNTPTTITLRGIDFSGYNASNGNNDSTLYFPSTTKSYTVNLVGCSGNISYRVGSGGSVSLVTNPVTLKVTVKDADDATVIQGVRVLIWVKNGNNYPYQASVSITSSGTTATVSHTAHGLSTNDNVLIEGANEEAYNGAYQITVTGVDAYTYTMAESASSPATGTLISTFCPINGDTDVNGEISDSRTYTVDQAIAGRARKSTSSPLYKQGRIDDIIDNVDGRDVSVFLISDE